MAELVEIGVLIADGLLGPAVQRVVAQVGRASGFAVPVKDPQRIFTDVGFVDEPDRQTQEAVSFLLHLYTVASEQLLTVAEPFVFRLGESGSASREFGRHAFVDFAVSDPLEELRRLFLFSLFNFVHHFQLRFATLLTCHRRN